MGKKATHTKHYDSQWGRTAKNKIKRISTALQTATGKGKELLEARLEYWKSGKKENKRSRRRKV